jgi:hypothetical protein
MVTSVSFSVLRNQGDMFTGIARASNNEEPDGGPR